MELCLGQSKYLLKGNFTYKAWIFLLKSPEKTRMVYGEELNRNKFMEGDK